MIEHDFNKGNRERSRYEEGIKYMRKKQKEKCQQKKNEQINSLELNQIIINQKILTEAIVKAYQIIEEEKIAKKIELEEKEKKEWQETIGRKEYPEDEKWYLKRFHIMRNKLAVVWNFLFFKPENVRDLRTTLGLMRLFIMGILAICKLCLYLVSFVMICSVFQSGIDGISNLIIAAFLWIFARAFRIASFEIEKIEDRDLVTAIFSGSISFAAMVIAIIAIVIEK